MVPTSLGWIGIAGEDGPVASIAPERVQAQLPAWSFFCPQKEQSDGSETTGGGGAFFCHGVPASDGATGPATSTPIFLSVAAIPPDCDHRKSKKMTPPTTATPIRNPTSD